MLVQVIQLISETAWLFVNMYIYIYIYVRYYFSAAARNENSCITWLWV